MLPNGTPDGNKVNKDAQYNSLYIHTHTTYVTYS